MLGVTGVDLLMQQRFANIFRVSLQMSRLGHLHVSTASHGCVGMACDKSQYSIWHKCHMKLAVAFAEPVFVAACSHPIQGGALNYLSTCLHRHGPVAVDHLASVAAVTGSDYL